MDFKVNAVLVRAIYSGEHGTSCIDCVEGKLFTLDTPTEDLKEYHDYLWERHHKRLRGIEMKMVDRHKIEGIQPFEVQA